MRAPSLLRALVVRLSIVVVLALAVSYPRVATVSALCERFRRGPNASGPGAGLGLAIAKCIMERQGGRLLLDTSANRGARFVMKFSAPS